MDELPSGTAAFVGAGAIARDPVSGQRRSAQFIDIDVDEVARTLTLLSLNGLGWLKHLHLVQAQAPEDTADRRPRDADQTRHGFSRPAFQAQRPDPVNDRGRGWPVKALWQGTEVLQTGRTCAAITAEPLVHGPRANACGSDDGLRRQPARAEPDNTLSTNGRKTGILVDVHRVCPEMALALIPSASPRSTG